MPRLPLTVGSAHKLLGAHPRAPRMSATHGRRAAGRGQSAGCAGKWLGAHPRAPRMSATHGRRAAGRGPSAAGVLVLCALLLLLAACHAAPPRGSSIEAPALAPRAADFALGAGDFVRVDVLGHPELSSPPGGVRIGPLGHVSLPLVGPLRVEGKDLHELHATLTEAFAEYMHDPVVTASVVDFASRYFHVLGNVAEPGLKTLDRPYNLLEAVAQGGALTRGANRARCYLLRPDGEELRLHRFNVESPGPDGLVRVRPGDVVFVPQTGTEDFQEDLLPIVGVLGIQTLRLARELSD